MYVWGNPGGNDDGEDDDKTQTSDEVGFEGDLDDSGEEECHEVIDKTQTVEVDESDSTGKKKEISKETKRAETSVVGSISNISEKSQGTAEKNVSDKII